MGLDTQPMGIKNFFIIFFLILTSCNKTYNTSKTNAKYVPKIIDFSLVNMKDGKKVWLVTASEALIDEFNNQIVVSTGVIKFYKKDDYISEMKFKKAVIDTKTNNIDFFGENIATTVEKEKIITYDTKYNSSENKVFSDKKIIIYRSGSVITGKGFETEDGFKNIKIKENIIVPQ
ncbi:MAG: LPS export ABC transporter periplasmic protein LptC [Endomicrobiia bacterium]